MPKLAFCFCGWLPQAMKGLGGDAVPGSPRGLEKARSSSGCAVGPYKMSQQMYWEFRPGHKCQQG